MVARRWLVATIVFVCALLLGVLLWRVLAPGGWSTTKLVMLASFAASMPWTGLCAANGLLGVLHPVRTVVPARGPGDARVAIVVTVRSEDMALVLPPLRRLLDELDIADPANAFALFVLSDTPDTDAARREADAVAAFRAGDRDPGRIRYRRRASNTGFKAGNLMDFVDHHADGFDFMLVLDADSSMTADAVLRLLATLHADPSLAIVQHLTVGLATANGFPRLFQFGMRAGMRAWAAGQDWWQGDEGPYWGHNALVRIAPFRAHARLPSLPDGSAILSHDQVEAALLQAAGWGVRVLVQEDGSAEANPPALPEHLRRELRWLAGNLQYRHLLTMRGLRPMGRWQLLQAILLFVGPPCHLLFLCAAALAAATDRISPFPAAPALALTIAWAGALYAPKWLGYAQVLWSPEERARYGGGIRFLDGILIETGFTLLLDAISAAAKSGAMLRTLCGAAPHWSPQNRSMRGVSWREAASLCWPQTILGILVFVGFGAAGWRAVLWAAPFALGLPLAIPFCVLTAHPAFGRWLQRHGLATIPEEHARTMPRQPELVWQPSEEVV